MNVFANGKEKIDSSSSNFISSYNVGCAFCSNVCDTVFNEKVPVYGSIDENKLIIDVREPPQIISALHLIEKAYSLGKRPDEIILRELEKECGSSYNGSCANGNDDISALEPDKKSIILIHKRYSIPAEELLSLYNDLHKTVGEYHSPRDAILQGPNTTNMNELVGYLEQEGVPFVGNGNNKAFAFFEENITDEIRDILELGIKREERKRFKPYHFLEKVKI